MASIIHSKNNKVYYNGVYWNNYNLVQKYLNRLSTGNENIFWADYIKIFFCKNQLFNKALIPNCGDGHVERMFINKKIIKEAVGTDWSEDLLNIASNSAKKLNLPIRYYKLDTNLADFPEENFDIVINHAAAHHIQYIYFVFHKLYKILLQSDGLFINYDYVGPHRNQYSANQWEKVYETNLSLPEYAQQNLLNSYAHVPTMLKTDPTEAIHSELIKDAFSLFFDTILYKPLGGSVAYPILTHNNNFASISDNTIQHKLLNQIIAADEHYLNNNPGSELFAFFIGKPKKNIPDQEIINIFQKIKEENQKESNIFKNNGKYYNDSCIAFLYNHIDQLNNKIKNLESKLCKK